MTAKNMHETNSLGVPLSVTNLAELSCHHARVRPERVAFSFEGRNTTYGEFDLLANQVANGLKVVGVSQAARVAIIDKNSTAFYEIVFGCAKSGAVAVGINWRLAPPEVAYILNDCQAEVLFVGPEYFELIESIQAEVPSLKKIVALNYTHPEWQRYASWRDQCDQSDPKNQISSEDVVIQMYTSGTTGRPKGAQIAHRGFFALWQYPANEDMAFNAWSENDRNLLVLPNFHIGGAGWGILGFLAGAENFILREIDAGQILDAIETHQLNKLGLVPAAIRLLLSHPKARTTDYACLEYIYYGASPIPLDLLREAVAVFQCGFVQLYGMTETTGPASYLPPIDHADEVGERMKSAGRPYPGVVVKILDADGCELATGRVGEICISSPVNMIGYWGLPEATADTLIDGFIHSGDAGYLDADGYIYVHDRVKDMIVSGGENIYPAEVESALFGHAAVADVAVIGVPDEQWGEAVKAIVVRKPGMQLAAGELIEFARSRIAGFKLPKTVDFMSELPRNPAGKILKRELRKPFWQGQARNVN